MNNPLKRSFYERSTLEVAPDLLGKSIVIQQKNATKKGIIVEVEAYTNDDPAAHCYQGMTPRTKVMFGPGGYSYVYFIYGMYHCLNFVSEKESIPGAVLIRAVEIPEEDFEVANGPGKLCRFFGLDKNFNNVDCCNSNSPIIVTDDNSYKKKGFSIVQTTRIGISKAQDYRWRWYIKESLSVSKKIKNKKQKSKTK